MKGFPEAEYQARLAQAQAAMERHGFGALLLTEEPDIRYFSGFLTRFWESPSRSWFLVLPAHGRPIAVIPAIGAALMMQTWVEDIRTWPAPQPDDDGVNLLSDTLRELGGPVALPMGYETKLRMPLADYERLKAISDLAFVADEGLVAALRAIKSEAEIAKIAHTCAIAGRAFDRVGEIAGAGTPLSKVFRNFQRLLLEEGADWVPYLAGGAGQGGYGDVISPATDAPLQVGDVLMLDTGAICDGYFCDFDRNFAVGNLDQAARDGHAQLIEATQAGFQAACPGAMARDVWQAMADIVGAGDTTGRLGHGLGMQLTEGLSLMAEDYSELRPGMVITLEPGIEMPGGKIMVHEENVAITETGAMPLSRFYGSEMTRL
ncbi:MAG: Xaa-Pro peptidase family protein [Pseudomonadota bacterium]